ncbi:MAG: beta-ketoacyl synthase N-terminal-like domain-containing protein [Actinophytocola sp.]|uniref:beta-ketoacyl synthase N-terminal-like domain-containing protein n=1 Tax=Actinophytocola sp. TaxID=1872138 RepID=UPI003C780E89
MADDPAVVVVGCELVASRSRDTEELWSLLRTSEPTFSEDSRRFDYRYFQADDPGVADSVQARGFGCVPDLTPHPGMAAERDAGMAVRDPAALWLRQCLLRIKRTGTMRAADRCLLVVGHPLPGSLGLDEAVVAQAVAGRMTGDHDAIRQRLRLNTQSPDDDYRSLPHQLVLDAAVGLLPTDHEVFVIDSACSSALYAVALGMWTLLAGEADVALCGGAYAVIPRDCITFSQARGMSATTRLRAFDAHADGAVLGDAAGLVVLKTAARARADGDRVLGVLAGVGTSSDGRGKAIYAPDRDGQRLAIDRAFTAARLPSTAVDWVVAHGTGTPVGDRAELRALADGYAGTRRLLVTSNKSSVGHSANASGVVSMAHALLALDHELIPAQPAFTALADPKAAAPLAVPVVDTPWPSDRPRTVGVSGFGFGGTNIHVLLSSPTGSGYSRPPAADEIVLVGWQALLPGGQDNAGVAADLRAARWSSPASFGDPFPAPPVTRTQVPPVTAQRIDRGQLMALECVNRFTDTAGEPWAPYAASTGVLVGHFGPTRAGIEYTLRCYLRLVAERLPGPAFEEYASSVRAAIGPTTLDAVGGIMPSCSAARVSKLLNLNGLTMAVDHGWDATLAAIEIARRVLLAGELDYALVISLNGNRMPELTRILSPYGVAAEPAEGAFLLVLTRAQVARYDGLAPLATLRRVNNPAAAPVMCGPVDGRTYLGADGAVAVLRAALGGAEPSVVHRRDGGPALTVQPHFSPR